MLCGILVVVALLGLLGTAPSASAEKCTVEIITHAHKVVAKVTVDSGESGCNEKFHTEDGSLKVCEAIKKARKASVEERNLPGAKSLHDLCDVEYEVNAFLVPVAATDTDAVRGYTVRFMLNNDITYDAGTKKLHILGVLVDFARARPLEALIADGTSLMAQYVSIFMMDGHVCTFMATAKFKLDDFLRELAEGGDAEAVRNWVDKTEPEEKLVFVQCELGEGQKIVELPQKIVELPGIPWSEIGTLFSQAKVGLLSSWRRVGGLLALCYNAVGVTGANQLEEQLKLLFGKDDSLPDESSSDESSSDDVSPTEMQGKAHHHQRKAHRTKHRGRARYARRARRGRGRCGR